MCYVLIYENGLQQFHWLGIRCALIGKVTADQRIRPFSGVQEMATNTCDKFIFAESHETNMSNEGILQIAKVYLRVALGGTFLTAIADRFGWLGTYGSRNVSWGDWSHFVQYVAVLNWFVPKSLIPALAAGETIIELGLGSALLLGIYQRVVAWSSAALLMSFCSHHEYCSWHSRAAELLGVHRARRRSNFGRSRTRPSHGSARSKLKQIILITCAEVRRELSSYIDNDGTP